MSTVEQKEPTKPSAPKPADAAAGKGGSLAGFLSTRLRQVGIFIALILIILVFEVLTGGTLLEPGNVANIITQNSYILILAIGMVMIIIAGHIDLSVGSVVGFVGAALGVMTVNMGLPWWLAIVLCLVLGALVGVWQGFWVAYIGIPAFIVTLAGMLIFRGLTMITLSNEAISGFPEPIVAIGSGFLPDPSGGTSILEFVTVILGVVATALLVFNALRDRKKAQKLGVDTEPFNWFALKNGTLVFLLLAMTFLLASGRGTPIVLLILGFLIVAYSAVMAKSIFGRHIYAIGGNLHAAELSGVKTKAVTFWLFVNMGVLAALAAIVFTARLNSAQPGAGNGFELEAIAAVFIGGAAVQGGIGTVGGAIIGGLIMGILNNGMSLMGLGQEYQLAIKGLVLLLAVGFDVFNKKRSGAN